MRKITQEAKAAWDAGRNFRKSNTTIMLGGLYIFGNKIAGRVARTRNGRKTPDIFTEICMHGYNTVTTRERLQAVGVTIVQRKGKPYFVQPDGTLVEISDSEYHMVTEDGWLMTKDNYYDVFY